MTMTILSLNGSRTTNGVTPARTFENLKFFGIRSTNNTTTNSCDLPHQFRRYLEKLSGSGEDAAVLANIFHPGVGDDHFSSQNLGYARLVGTELDWKKFGVAV